MADLHGVSVEQIETYIAVIETGSFTRAAERLHVGKTVVTKTIQRLEAAVGASLIVRTTRRVGVTEAGQAFLETGRKILQLLGDTVAAARPDDGVLRGALRVASSIEYGGMVLVPALAALRREHPGLRIELLTDDRNVDLVEAGIDVAIRLGDLPDSSLRATRLGTSSRWLMASPDFLGHHPLPEDVGGLAALPYVGLSIVAQPRRCKLVHAGGDERDLVFEDAMLANSVHGCRLSAVAGAGLALLPDFTVGADVDAGRLVRVFPEWATPPVPIHAVIPPGRYSSPNVRVLVDKLRPT